MDNPFILLEQQILELSAKVDLLISQLPQPCEAGNLKDVGGLKIAVEETGLSRHTIYRLVCERRIPHRKKCGRLYFSRKDIRAWIESGERKTKSK